MHLTHLSLSHFRNYERLEIDLPTGVSIFWGENAQGKTNLLEAVALLSTTRSPRIGADAEIVRWQSGGDGQVAARIVGRAARGRTSVQVEIAVLAREGAGAGGGAARSTKRLRVNGLPRRASDVVGNVLAVLFTSGDIDLLTGAPAIRRRYLDLTLSQVDHPYLRALSRYQRVMQQRNILLRRISDGEATAESLAAWDEEMVVQGAIITRARAAAVAELSTRAATVHDDLSDGRERLEIAYRPQLSDERRTGLPESDEELRNLFRAALHRRQAREIGAGVSLVGPHRDDLTFALDGKGAGTYGSRAQQRTVALALRLAEAEFLRAASGQAPILLLDDILSELDGRRRTAVLASFRNVEQALITTAEIDRFDDAFIGAATVFSVRAGEVSPIEGGSVSRADAATD